MPKELKVKENMSDPAVIGGKVKEHEERIGLLEEKGTETSEDIKHLANEFQDYKDSQPIPSGDLEKLRRLGATIIHSMLGDSDSEEYQAHYKIFFGHLWQDFRREFSIHKYSELPRNKFLDGLDYVERWEPRQGVQGLMDEDDRRKAQRKADEIKAYLQAAAMLRQEAAKGHDI